MTMFATVKKIARFYVDGFRNMTVGRTLWIIILIKLAVIFAVLRVFFFQPALKGADMEERGDEVLQQLTTHNDTIAHE
ncbi:MAG: DUF4492 domain-containing protein [Alistipes sp.]|nr:DUF4492 domain-containing protein [Alistipes sp.]